jgi:hypothetical protein
MKRGQTPVRMADSGRNRFRCNCPKKYLTTPPTHGMIASTEPMFYSHGARAAARAQKGLFMRHPFCLRAAIRALSIWGEHIMRRPTFDVSRLTFDASRLVASRSTLACTLWAPSFVLHFHLPPLCGAPPQAERAGAGQVKMRIAAKHKGLPTEFLRCTERPCPGVGWTAQAAQATKGAKKSFPFAGFVHFAPFAIQTSCVKRDAPHVINPLTFDA